MSIELEYEFLVILLAAVVALALAARYIRLPEAAALIVGGLALAFIPGLPVVTFDPALVMVVFLPPILLSSAYQTVWLDFKQYFAAISSLAVGAVVFTTLSVGLVVHVVRPDLPWASCFALGAIVSPPDAAAVKAILEKLRLPDRVSTVLTGESLVNDASGLVLFHLAISWASNGTISPPDALVSLLKISIGGIAFGFGFGWAALHLMKRFDNSELIVTGTLLLAAVSYMLADYLGFSGVLATVTTGLMLGWQQHEIYSAATRIKAQAFWRVLVFLLESLLFVLIGLALRQALASFETVENGLRALAVPVSCVVLTVIVARFVWLVGSDLVLSLLLRFGIVPRHPPSLPMTLIVSWAGMRGVVTLAAALSLPIDFAGRDLILASAFGVILITVLVQASTLPLLISLFPSIGLQTETQIVKQELAVRRKIARKQRKAMTDYCAQLQIDPLEFAVIDLGLASIEAEPYFDASAETRPKSTTAHFEAALAAIRTGRAEALRLYRHGDIPDGIMRNIEQDLDLQEIAAETRLNGSSGL